MDTIKGNGNEIRQVARAIADWVAVSAVSIDSPSVDLDWGLFKRILNGENCRDDLIAYAEKNNRLPYVSLSSGKKSSLISPELHQFIIDAVKEYIIVRFQSGKSLPAKFSDIEASSLLRRLLSGKKALPHPPPLSYSEPWYALMEEPGRHKCAVGGNVSMEALLNFPQQSEYKTIVINQSIWKVLSSNKAQNSYLVQWREDEEVFRVFLTEEGWFIEKTGGDNV